MAAPRPAKDIKPTDLRSTFLKDAKQEKLRKDAEELRRKAKKQAEAKKPQPAKDVQKGDMRSKALQEAKKFDAAKPRPAADLKPGDMRSKALEDAKKNAAKRGAAAAAARSGLTRGIIRYAGPVGALVSMTTEANSDEQEWLNRKNRGPLMKGNTNLSSGDDREPRGSRVNSNASAKSDRPAANRSYGSPIGPNKPAAARSYDSPIGPKKPTAANREDKTPQKFGTQFKSDKAKDFAAKGQGRAGVSNQNSTSNQGSKADKKTKMVKQGGASNFKGNWKNAAPTKSQSRGGALRKETAYQRMMRISREK